jgi:hypothetical protein
MSSTEHARSQPEGRARKKPGTTGEGKYYRIVVRSKEDFVTFRYHNVPEMEKPTPAQKRSRMENIRKAQQARRK